jgi:membrane protein YdbS with pleckstrin-like domain
MNAAEIAWIVVGAIVALVVLVFAIKMIPEIRRYLRMKQM